MLHSASVPGATPTGPPPTPPATSSARAASLGRAVGTVVLLALLLALAERGCRVWVARLFLPTGMAQWIWDERPAGGGEAVGLVFVRDFTLDHLPAAAELAVAGDEEYLVYLNGALVGSGSLRQGSRLDRYEVRDLLVVGGNRLAAELRSSRAAGGFLAALRLDDRLALYTDESWRVFRWYHLGLVRGWLPAGEGEPVRLWALPPTGRWRIPPPGPLARVALAVGPPPPTMRAAAIRRSPPGGRPPAGQAPAVFDFGREVSGYLRLHYRGAQSVGELRFAGAGAGRQPDPRRAADQLVIGIPGKGWWRDAQPRRFRWVAVSGLPWVARAEVLPGNGAARRGTEATPGLLGIARPPLRAAPEDELGRGF